MTWPRGTEALPVVCALPATADPAFDRFARMVSTHLNVPVALVSMVSRTEQVFPGIQGLGEPWLSARRTPISHSFCQHVLVTQKPLVVTDARLDPRVADNPAIQDLDVVAYAGMPLRDEFGTVVGSLCAIDTEPREWAANDLVFLSDLAEACSAELQLRRAQLTAETERGIAERARLDAERSATQAGVLLELSVALNDARTVDEIADRVSEVADKGLGTRSSSVAIVDRNGVTASFVDGSRLWAAAAAHPTFGLDTFRLDTGLPGPQAIRENRMLFSASREDLLTRFPQLADSRDAGHFEASAYLPLREQGTVFGLLVLVWDTPQELVRGDMAVMIALARFASQALQRAKLLQELRESASTLQAALLGRMPLLDGLDLVTAYRPAAITDRVGGDWYDGFTQPSGAHVVVIGDVAGHDIRAAAAMGQLRSLFVAHAIDEEVGPAELLRRVDVTISRLGLPVTATCLVLRIVPPAVGGEPYLITWSNAGHPPAVLVPTQGPPQLLEERPQVMLGVLRRPRTEHTLQLAPGSRLVLYTDGLVERRGESLDAGLSRLLAAAGSVGDRSPVELVRHLLHGAVNPDWDEDDVAVLLIRLHEHGHEQPSVVSLTDGTA